MVSTTNHSEKDMLYKYKHIVYFFKGPSLRKNIIQTARLQILLHVWTDVAVLINERAAPIVFVIRVWSRNSFRVSGTEVIGVPV